MGIFKKINMGLRKTRNNMSGAIDNVLDSYTSIDEELFNELEEALVMGDVGVATAAEITARLNESVRKKGITDPAAVKDEIKEIVADMLEGGEDMGLVTVPSVILVIGVNGVGKTTTIGKMAAMYKRRGKSVILGAADTFRAAAIDQLCIWAERADVEIVKHKEGADPAAVIFDTISAAKSRGSEIIICDTAGRLHNKKNLMEELAKIYRVIDRELPYSDREVLLVLDATTGQNAVSQAREFKNVADITGIVLTKLDGTARGGVVLSIKNDLNVPVKFIGVGEAIDDLQPFNPRAFADGLFDALPDDFEEDEDDAYTFEEASAVDNEAYVETVEESGYEDSRAEPEIEPASDTEKEGFEEAEQLSDNEDADGVTASEYIKEQEDIKDIENIEYIEDTEDTEDMQEDAVSAPKSAETPEKKKKGFFGSLFGKK